LFFSESNCEECVNSAILQLNEQKDLIGSDKIIILINALSKRYVSQYKINNQLKYPVFEIATNQEFFSPSSFPIFFMIEKETLRINSAYIPLKENPKGTKDYFNKIAKDYF
jgi:hypothetical protein